MVYLGDYKNPLTLRNVANLNSVSGRVHLQSKVKFYVWKFHYTDGMKQNEDRKIALHKSIWVRDCHYWKYIYWFQWKIHNNLDHEAGQTSTLIFINLKLVHYWKICNRSQKTEQSYTHTQPHRPPKNKTTKKQIKRSIIKSKDFFSREVTRVQGK